ncbi:MAG: rod shape-determining protein MreD [Candidatus Limimorpha sp.]
MHNSLIRNIFRFVGLLLLQVLVFDNIRFGQYIHPYLYVLFVMLLPFDTPKWQLLLAGFFIGIAVDIFNRTPGLNAAASVLMAFVRPYVINLTTRKNDIQDRSEPSPSEMGFKWFLFYALILLIIHNLALFMTEAFSFRLIGMVVVKVLMSVPVSLFMIMLIVYLFKPFKK